VRGSAAVNGPSLRQLRMLALLLLCWASVTPARAKTHPSLGTKIDDSSCLECHAAKAKGKSVHSAVSKGCSGCHQVRVDAEVTRIKLVSVTTGRLCLQCHANKDASQIKGHVHSPDVRDCITCHDPHSSNNKNQLLKPVAGEAKDNLCLSCHRTGLDVAETGSRHEALDSGCDSCHVDHKVGQDIAGQFHIAKAAPALCLDCHDPQDAKLIQAHRSQPIAKTDCLECHDPHQSDSPKLLQKFVHDPFSKRQCEKCHAPAQNGKVVLVKAEVKELCISCHADQAKKIASSAFQHEGATGDCTDCHSPHSGTSPGFLKPDAVNVCLVCHSDQAELHSKKVLHQPAFQQGCAACHDPHGNDHPKLLRAEGNALCLECHGPDAKPTLDAKNRLALIFDGKVKLPLDYFAKVVRLPLQGGLGHPVLGHPISDVRDPADDSKVKAKLDCLSCHQPHASSGRALLVTDQPPNLAFCRRCHTETAQGVGLE
jgi:predicted CXXCH cytochrome family protein